MKKQFTPEALFEAQELLEAEMFGNGILRFEKNNERAIEQGAASETAWFRRLTKAFIEPYALALQAYLDYYSTRAGKPSRSLLYLRMLPTNVSAYVAIKVIFDSLPQEGVSAQNVAEKIGRRIEDQVRFTKLEDSAPKYLEAIKDGLKRSKSQNYDHAHKVLVHAEKKLNEDDGSGYLNDVERWVDWPKVDCVQLGSRLIDIFADNVQYNGEPVVQKDVKDIGNGRNKSVCYLVPTEAIVDWIEEFKEAVGALSPCYAPCVVQPRDWKTPNNGGYHTVEVATKLPMVKCSDKKHLRKLSRSKMPKVYQCLNALQAVPWQVSDRVMAVAQEISERDIALAMPSKEPIFLRPAPIPLELQHLRGQELREALTPSQWDSFVEWKQEAAGTYDAERERRSKYLESVRTMAQARKYSLYEALFFVYTLDFRGRVYCQSSLISPQGGDLQKGLLRFSNGMELGKDGRYWLAVQGANVWGEDKVSFADRVKFIEEMSEDIRDYAADPLSFKGWAGADKPWQFLNWCFEWANLLDWEDEGKKTEDFISHIPVAMDGSCSGIQHYSAMLRDDIGGAAVNLVPSEKPQDIYGEVAKVVIRKLKGLIDEEADVVQQTLAKYWLDIGITRGMTKKSVMTLPYGSTQLTCRESVGDYLNDLVAKESKSAKAEGRSIELVHPFSTTKSDPCNRFEAEKLVSSLIWTSIGEVVVAARAGMSFIKSITKFVAKANIALEWTTPTGFIVSQSIYKMEKCRIKTQLMGATDFTLLEPTDDIDVRRMGTSCAPNYVHSFDASHLTLAVCSFDDRGITDIAVIHDSFGGHAGVTQKLRDSLVSSFIEMYERKHWLLEFKEESEAAILEEIEVPVPSYGNLDLSGVRYSNYCFA